MSRIKKNFPAVFTLIAFVLITALYTACTLRQDGNGGGNSSSQGNPSALPQGNNIVYVATNGSDANDGISKTTPLLTLQKAVSNAMALGFPFILAGEGTYTPGAGLSNLNSSGLLISNNNLKFYGGCDSGYNYQTGRSVLDATNGLRHVVSIYNAGSVMLNGFVLKGGNSTNSVLDNDGAGIYASNITYCVITNCKIEKNFSGTNGGGIFLYRGHHNSIYGEITGNEADSGAGIYLTSTASNIINANVCLNKCGYTCSAYYIDGDYNLVLGAINTNFTALMSSAISISGNFNEINASFLSNKGGCVIDLSGHNNVIRGLIRDNDSFNDTIEISGDSNMISCTIGNNLNMFKSDVYSSGDNTQLINSLFFNTHDSVVVSFPVNPFIISNCIFSNAANITAIFVTAGLTGQVLKNNLFYTNYIKSLYYTGPVCLSNINDLNNPVKTGATADSINNSARP